MPMKPAAPESEAADREADRDLDVLDEDQRDEQDHADDRDGRVLAVQVGARRPPGRPRRWSRIRSLPGESASSEREVSAP